MQAGTFNNGLVYQPPVQILQWATLVVHLNSETLNSGW